jgi:hypothetical protein
MKVAGPEARVRVRALTGSPVKVGEAGHGVADEREVVGLLPGFKGWV